MPFSQQQCFQRVFVNLNGLRPVRDLYYEGQSLSLAVADKSSQLTFDGFRNFTSFNK